MATAARNAAVLTPGSIGLRATRMHSTISTITQAIMPPAISLGRGTRSTINMERTLAMKAADTQHAARSSWTAVSYPRPA